ncbi:MAG: hypothetical protein M0Z71_05695 [Nitrospiraceae bacterium]|nr:hypothetical protein [Nitrospiraceae bacterium]
MGKYLIKGTKVNLSQMLLFVVAFAFVNSFVYYFISQERYIYFWDYYNYWVKYQNLGDLLMYSPVNAFSEIWRTIRQDDYNLLPVLFLMPFRLLFGAGRLPYILAIANVYVLPSAILCTALVRNLTSQSDQRESFLAELVTLSTFLLFVQFWNPVFLGYPDAAGVVVIFCILLVLCRTPVEDMSAKTLISLGLMLAFLVLLRRWYAYWVVSFFVALAAERSVALFSRSRLNFKKYFSAARNIIVIGCAATAVFFLIAGPQATKMLSTDYADIYSAYKSDNTLSQIFGRFYWYFGPFTTVIFVAGLLYSVYAEKTRHFSIFLIVHSICVVVLFSRVQNFGAQHLYQLMPSMILVISLFASGLLKWVKNLPLRLSLSSAYVAILTIQIFTVFIPGVADKYPKITPFITGYRHYPLVRNDLGEIRKLLDVLGELVRNDTEGIYVVASSTIINDDILRNACRAFDYPQSFCNKIFASSHVDKKDGFPKNLLSAGYVVVAEPEQYHLRPEDQRVIGILAEQMHLKGGIGSSFDALNYEFLLDNDVRVHIYKKMRPFDGTALHHLEDLFVAYYPDKKEIFTVPEIHKGAD